MLLPQFPKIFRNYENITNDAALYEAPDQNQDIDLIEKIAE